MERLPYQTPVETHEFLKQVLKEGAHLKRPPRLKEDSWIRGKNMVGIYYGCESASRKTIGRAYGIFPQQVSQTARGVMLYFRSNSTSETQMQYPPSVILQPKVLQLSPKREKEPYLSPYQRVEKRLEQAWALDDEKEVRLKIQQILDDLTIGMYRRGKAADPPIFIPETNLAVSAGYHISSREVVLVDASLRRPGVNVPTGDIQPKDKLQGKIGHYRFIYFKYQERGIAGLRTDENLQPFLVNPVSQLCGPPLDSLPSSYRLSADKDQYQPLLPLLLRLGIYVGRGAIRSTSFYLEGCPVPVFGYDTKYAYAVDQEENLGKYLLKRKEAAQLLRDLRRSA